jgi:hypothetical protein
VSVTSLAFSPVGDLAVGQGTDVHLVAGDRTVKLAIGDEVTCVAFRDARTLAVAGKRRGLSIIALGGMPRVTRIRHECAWHMMLWSPDGKYIVGGQYEPWVTVIDVEAERELRTLDPDEFDDSGRTALAFAGDTLYSTAYNKLVRWRWADVLAGKARCRTKHGVTGHAHVMDLAQLPDGSMMALVDHEEQHTHLHRFAPTGDKVGRRIETDRAFRVAVAGDALVLAGETAWLADLAGKKLRDLDCDVGEVREIATYRDRIAIGGTGGYQLIGP